MVGEAVKKKRINRTPIDRRPPRVSGFARRVLAEWRRNELPTSDERIVLAVSGGADSMALLLSFDELIRAARLALTLTVAHLDHGLRGARGAADAVWVAERVAELGHDFAVGYAAVGEIAGLRRDNLEQSARRARYEFLIETARRHSAGMVLTAHTMDDQAETVLLRILRGSGAEGLGGMRPVRPLEDNGNILLVRPLLNWARRRDTEEFCRAREIAFRIDELNEDEHFARVRVRRQLVPLLQTFNPRVVETLVRTAGLLREDAATLDEQAAQVLRAAARPDGNGQGGAENAEKTPALCVEVLRRAPRAVRRRALRLWISHARGSLRRVELVHVCAIEKLLVGNRGGRIAELPGGGCIERRRQQLLFRFVKKVEKA